MAAGFSCVWGWNVARKGRATDRDGGAVTVGPHEGISRNDLTIRKDGGAEGSRTPDLLIANEALYQLSYGPRKARNKAIEGLPVKRVREASPCHGRKPR
jgi:hypothetical protein